MTESSVLVSGLYFGEGLRWHDDRLYYSDFYAHSVFASTADGTVEKVVEIGGMPSGLGWLPDGRMLVVSMEERCVLAVDNGVVSQHADLSEVAGFRANDMLVLPEGRAYVGDFAFDLDGLIDNEGPSALFGDPGPPKGTIAVVEADGSVRAGPDQMRFANGTCVTPDGGVLVVAETLGNCLTAFDIGADGSLSGRRLWAELGYVLPDGICMDAEGCVWLANAVAPECLRVAEGGEVRGRVDTTQAAYSCCLGGPRGTTLFVATAAGSHHSTAGASRSGHIRGAEVEVPGIGSP
jgi:sugar lactone lactonase YvrE